MKKALCFLLGLSLVFCLTACQKETPAPEKPVSEEGPPDAGTENAPAEDQAARPGLFWETGIAPVEYEMDWTVEGTAETYVLELTDPKYQGRAGGSEGNRAAAGWLAEQFSRVGLQKLPTLGSWKQTYQTTVTAVLPGEAFLVSPDGEETELKLGEDWVFRASPDAVDLTAPLSTDYALYSDGKAVWDAGADPKNASRKLCLITGDVSRGMPYTNANGTPSRVLVTDAVYGELKKDGYQLHLKLPDAVDEEGSAENVVGFLPGKDPTKAVVLGANFDGPGQCGPLLMPGAYNNASGVAALVQTAAWLAQAEELPCDVIFAAFNTEDSRQSGLAALSGHIAEQYAQVRMVNLKCLGWRGQPVTVYGTNSEAALRGSLAGGLGLQYADRDIASSAGASNQETVSSVTLFQDACLSDADITAALNTVYDTAGNLDFAMLDDIAKKLAAWVIERGDEPLTSYVVYW